MNANVRSLTRAAMLLALLLAVQSLRLGQGFTGPIVNALLYLATVYVGVTSAAFIGAVSPWAALTVGILRAPLAPAVPFIMLGNAALVTVFGLLRDTNAYLGVATASVVKFAIIAGAVRFVIAVPPPLAVALGVPQLLTALGGGAIALLVMASSDAVLRQRGGSGQ